MAVPFDELRAASAIREFLLATGVDPDVGALAATPRRVCLAFREFFSGVDQDPVECFQGGEAFSGGHQIIALKAIEFRSICVHHLLPFSGVAEIAYVPAERIIGIGTFASALEVVASRPQLQEHLGQMLADAITAGAGAQGALVVLRARQSCIADRGSRNASSELVTLASSGSMDGGAVRREALTLLGGTRTAGS